MKFKDGSRGDGTSLWRRSWEQLAARRRGSLEAVEHLALQAVLDLAPAQHELQHLVDGVLRVLLQSTGRMQERVPRTREPTRPCEQLESLHLRAALLEEGLRPSGHLLCTGIHLSHPQ